MKLDIQRSIIYDTVRFFDIYFNYEKIRKDLEVEKIDLDTSFTFFELIKKMYTVDLDLSSLFALNGNKITLLMRYLLYKLDTVTSLDKFIFHLKDDEFKEYIEDFYFSESPNRGKITRMDIYNLDDTVNDKEKISLSFVLSNYESTLELLIKSLKEIYSIVNEIFDINIKKVKQFKLSANHIKTLERISCYSFTEQTVYYVSLLDPYSFRYTFFDDIFYWNFGIYSHIRIESTDEYNYINVTYESVVNLLNNKLTVELLDIIKNSKEIRPSELIQLMEENYNCSASTVYRLISNLLSEKAIIIHKRDNKRVYYSINIDYFNHAAKFDNNENIRKYINSFLLPNEDYKKVIELLSNDYVLPILNIIREYKQINSSKIIDIISTKYNCSASTIYRIITMMLENKVIYVSKKSSNKIFYSINEAYFIKAEQEMSNLLQYYIYSQEDVLCI